MKSAGRERRFQFLPECDGQIFSRRQNSGQEIHIKIQIGVVALFHDLILDDALQVCKIHHVSRIRVRSPCDRYFEHVIMSMPVRRIALSERISIPVVGLVRIVQSVGCIKMNAARHIGT